MERRRIGNHHGGSVVGRVAVEGHDPGGDLVDVRRGAGYRLLNPVDDSLLECETGAGSMFIPDWLRSEFDWSPVDWASSAMAFNGGEKKMNERRKAETIGELDTHLGYMMQELGTLSQELREMREHFTHIISLLATKEELNHRVRELEDKIAKSSVSNTWRTIVWIASGVTAIAAAIGVVVALVRSIGVGSPT
jgi:hypothetical protein